MTTAAFVPNKYLSPFRWVFRTRGYQWLRVINRLNGHKRFSEPLWEVIKLSFAINTSRIRNRAVRKKARQKYCFVASLPDKELAKEINFLTHNYRGQSPKEFDFQDSLAQKLTIIYGILESQRSNSRAKTELHKKWIQKLIDNDILENILMVMEWLRRNPAN